ncbi:MAG: hypothetical protein ACHQNE_01735 [Candidatus Kapaibacterium sp.]
MLNRVSGIVHDAAGHFKARAFEAAFTFAFGGAIFLAAHHLTSEPASAQSLPNSRVASGPVAGPVAAPVTAPDQHRAPYHPMVRPLPAPAPLPAPNSLQRRADPIQIDPSQRQEIVQRQANEMKREHCLRKLEARRRALLEERAERNYRPK